MKKPDFEDVVGIFMIAIAVLFATVLCVAVANAQDISEASNLHLIAEMAQRGLDRFGCWAETIVLCRWDPPENGSQVDYYVVEIKSSGFLIDMDVAFHRVYAESLYTYWPPYTDTLTARVAAVGSGGQGEWTEPTMEVLQ